MPYDPESVIMLLDFLARVAPSAAHLVDAVKGGEPITAAELAAATEAAHTGSDAWDQAVADTQPTE